MRTKESACLDFLTYGMLSLLSQYSAIELRWPWGKELKTAHCHLWFQGLTSRYAKTCNYGRTTNSC